MLNLNVFDFVSYKAYLAHRIRSLPGHGRGELSKIAKALGIHTTMMSHVLKAHSHFSMEQTLALSDFLGLSELETDYLIALVQFERAGDQRTQSFYSKKMNEIKKRALSLKDRLNVKNELSESDRALYYSSPTYSQIRLLTAVERFQSADALADELGISLKKLRKYLDFLISRGLCLEQEGKISYAAKSTYVDADSPMALRHHLNWRGQCQRGFENLREEDLVFTYPTIISENDFLKIRESLIRFINEFKKTTEPSPSDHLYCFNIDWLKISKN